jgi:3-hydroxyisobutyrate dehydrogenase-like beta-hydroxyacid dehydrogenase
MGRMGRASAERLLDTGHEVTVWNRTPGRAAPVLARGATPAGTPAEAAAGADDAVLLSLSDDAAVDEVVTGANGVLAGLLGSAVLVDQSTVAPATSRRLAAATPGGRFLAAPIAGSPAQVAAGEARLLVGGPRTCHDLLRPLFEDLAGGSTYCGEDPGSSTTLKIVNNYLLLGSLAVLADAVALAEAAGLDRSLLDRFLQSSPMVPAGLQNRLDDVVHGTHDGWFTTVLGAKDVALAATLAGDRGLALPLVSAVEERYRTAAGTDLADRDVAAVVEVARRRRGAPGGPASPE